MGSSYACGPKARADGTLYDCRFYERTVLFGAFDDAQGGYALYGGCLDDTFTELV